MNGIQLAITVLGGLALFLYGMKIMSESLQMAAGERLRNILSKVTNNRIAGVITGFSITSLIQSSSATTVMLVSFVSAGLINLTQSVGIILGANIGTTVTGWIVAILGFKFKIASFALPSIAIGFFIRFINDEKIKQMGDILLGFGILFYGLDIMKDAVSDLKGSPVIENFMQTYTAETLLTTIIVVIIGSLVTMVIQSSSATMAITLTLAATKTIDITTACALVLGENIGTTITANIASLGASITARRSARVHMLFNVFGVVWVLACFPFFLDFVDWMVPGDSKSGSKVVISAHLAAFHTSFNIINTLLFLPFVNFLAWAASKLVRIKEEDQDEFHLKYISTVLVSTPSINIDQARMETKRMLNITQEMFAKVIDVFRNPDVKMGKVIEDIQTKENTVDLLEKEISDFLVKVSQNAISTEQSQTITSMLHMVNEIERIGDHCERLLKLLRRKYSHKYEFTGEANSAIEEMSDKITKFLELLSQTLMEPKNILPKADVLENRIDELRKEMRKNHVARLNEGTCDVNSGLVYIDMVTSFEKIGDHAFNVAEGLSGERVN